MREFEHKIVQHGDVLTFSSGIHSYFFGKALHTLRQRLKHDCTAHCTNCRAARGAAAEESEDRYTDIVEVAAAPRESGAGKIRV
jgi:hypothetical protein